MKSAKTSPVEGKRRLSTDQIAIGEALCAKWARAESMAGHILKCKTTPRLELSGHHGYYLAGRQEAEANKQFSSCMDAARVGGEELMNLCVCFFPSQLSMWLPPQVTDE